MKPVLVIILSTVLSNIAITQDMPETEVPVKVKNQKDTFFEVEVAKASELYELLFNSKELIEKKEINDKD